MWLWQFLRVDPDWVQERPRPSSSCTRDCPECWIRNLLTFWQELRRETAPAWMDSVSKGPGADGLLFFSAVVRWWKNWMLQENIVVTGHVLLRAGVP